MALWTYSTSLWQKPAKIATVGVFFKGLALISEDLVVAVIPLPQPPTRWQSTCFCRTLRWSDQHNTSLMCWCACCRTDVNTISVGAHGKQPNVFILIVHKMMHCLRLFFLTNEKWLASILQWRALLVWLVQTPAGSSASAAHQFRICVWNLFREHNAGQVELISGSAVWLRPSRHPH